MKSFSKYLLLLSVLLAACTDEPTKTLDGYFRLVQIQSSANGRVLATSEESPAFNLGDLKASKEFYFLLQSTDGAITDITLEVDNPGFTVTPGNISELSENGSIIPLVAVGITHGVHLNGFGFTDILDMGEHSATLTIRGKTVVDGDIVNVESSFTFTVNAKVMDVELFDGDTERDLTLSDGTTSGVPNAGGLGAVEGYVTESGTIKIKNTGNVNIRVKAVTSFSVEDVFHDAVITPGQSTTFDITDKYFVHVTLDGNGTITDNNRIQLGNDGSGHFWLEKAGE